jgi:hypothetical protein
MIEALCLTARKADLSATCTRFEGLNMGRVACMASITHLNLSFE